MMTDTYNPTRELEPLIEFLQGCTYTLYELQASTPKYDMGPVFFAGCYEEGRAKIKAIVSLEGGHHPKDNLPAAVNTTDPEFGVVISPAWIKDAANQRTGELVIMIVETPSETRLYTAKVNRDEAQRPSIERFEARPGEDCGGAMTHFINRTPSMIIVDGPNTRQ
jgi:hypothetical protein